VVTGGARGCGLAFAQGLAEAGADVVVLDLMDPAPEFHDISTAYSVKTWFFKVDVSSVASLQKAFSDFLKETNGALDICVACAGVNRNLAFTDTDEASFDKLNSVNVKGVFFTAQMAAKAMIANKTTKGSIIMVASIAAFRAVRGQMSSAYCGTKGAVKSMVPPIAVELAQHGIRVNSISPGYVRTEMTGMLRANASLGSPKILLTFRSTVPPPS
jgi:NAD(P)-dependent dehydrogenase (short-subunit alcohol dehydrogenase family)